MKKKFFLLLTLLLGLSSASFATTVDDFNFVSFNSLPQQAQDLINNESDFAYHYVLGEFVYYMNSPLIFTGKGFEFPNDLENQIFINLETNVTYNTQNYGGINYAENVIVYSDTDIYDNSGDIFFLLPRFIPGEMMEGVQILQTNMMVYLVISILSFLILLTLLPRYLRNFLKG